MKYKGLLFGSLAGIALSGGAAIAEDLTIWTINYTSDAQVGALEDSIAQFEA